MNEQTRMKSVGSIEYLLLYRWRRDDPSTRFAVHMLIMSIPVWLLLMSLHGAQTATMSLVFWIGMTLVASTFYNTLSRRIK